MRDGLGNYIQWYVFSQKELCVWQIQLSILTKHTESKTELGLGNYLFA